MEISSSLSSLEFFYSKVFLLMILFDKLFDLGSGGLVAKSCPTLGDHMDYSLPGSSVPGILQAGILKWISTSFSRGFS